jgi:hypothetical protein
VLFFFRKNQRIPSHVASIRMRCLSKYEGFSVASGVNLPLWSMKKLGRLSLREQRSRTRTGARFPHRAVSFASARFACARMRLSSLPEKFLVISGNAISVDAQRHDIRFRFAQTEAHVFSAATNCGRQALSHRPLPSFRLTKVGSGSRFCLKESAHNEAFSVFSAL